MTIQSLKQNRTWLMSAALLAIMAGVFVARTGFARIAKHTIDPVALASAKGRHLVLTGPIAITDGEKAIMRVTVTQRTTGAVAGGDVILDGTGTTNQWQVLATAQDVSGTAVASAARHRFRTHECFR